jgi:hypothetical protein
MRRSATTTIVLLLAAILALLTALAVGRAQPNGQSSGPPPPPGGGTPVISTSVPTPGGPALRKLTKKQQQNAVKILGKDKTFKRLINKKSYKVSSIGIWLTKSGTLLGGTITLRLKKRATINGTWLYLDYDCSEQTSPPYRAVPFQAKYKNIIYMTAAVDLTRKKVVSIMPAGILVGQAYYPPGFKPNPTCQTS